MFTHRRFTLFQAIAWTIRDLMVFFVISIYPVYLYEVLEFKWLGIPALPIALMGTAVAFNLGFKNNNAYNRVWEARKIWGGITNFSRTWGIMCLDFVNNHSSQRECNNKELQEMHQELIYRHIALVTALRYQMRSPREWERHSTAAAVRFREKFFVIEEHQKELKEALSEYLTKEEIDDCLARPNTAAHIIRLQSQKLKKLREKGLIDDFRHVAMLEMLGCLYNQQGKSERIKNFPFPRQYASVSFYFVAMFVLVLPFTMLAPFAALGQGMVWLTVPFSILVSWIFYTMEKIGDLSENPFEGRGTDVPITAMTRGIEINLKDMLNEGDLPPVLQPHNHIIT